MRMTLTCSIGGSLSFFHSNENPRAATSSPTPAPASLFEMAPPVACAKVALPDVVAAKPWVGVTVLVAIVDGPMSEVVGVGTPTLLLLVVVPFEYAKPE